MRQTANFHEVTSVTIGPNEQSGQCAYRDVIITMRDGEKVRLTMFADDGALVSVVQEDAEVKMMNGEEA